MFGMAVSLHIPEVRHGLWPGPDASMLAAGQSIVFGLAFAMIGFIAYLLIAQWVYALWLRLRYPR